MRLSRIAAVAGLCLSAACDLPTEAPVIDQRWVVPIKSTTISVSQLLPNNVTISGTRFAVTVPALTTTQSLSQVCPTCPNGSAPPPAINYSFTSQPQNLPANVSGADLASGTIGLRVDNGFSFDPTSGTGKVVITVMDGVGGRVLGKDSIINGGLQAGGFTNRTITLSPGTIGTSIVSSTTITSPGGGSNVTLNTGSELKVTATPANVLVNSASVNVANKAFNIDPQNLDVKDIETDVTDHLQSGAIVLDVTNPFGVAMSDTIRINYPGGSLVKPVTLTNALNSSVSLSYTGQELRLFLGKDNVTLTGSGRITSGSVITVTPTQVVNLKAKLDANIRLGTVGN